ncbi:MAG: hypothetical protein IJ542_01170 [Clostridia bacterium]|nr:hypothetical protein [Clostridia bacterium]
MNMFNIALTIGSAGMVSAASPQPSAWEVIGSIFKDIFKIGPILNLVGNLLYTLFVWLLSIIDFAFVLIRELCGLNTDFSSLKSVEESDIIFRFIFSDNVKSIMKYLLILAVVVILVLGIIAIIKNEYDAVIDKSNSGEIKNDKSGIWKSIFQSLLLLFLVPMILFGGLILSNGLLQTIYNYTAGGANNKSVGTQIFMASSYNANALRTYALSNKKIPITYNTHGIEDMSFTGVYTEGAVDELKDTIVEFKNAEEWVRNLTTFWMFYTDTFYETSQIDYLERVAPNNNYYQMAYDRNIQTYSYEYLTNADAIDYMFENGQKLYYLTVKEAYDNLDKAGNINVQRHFQTVKNDEVITEYDLAVNYNDNLAVRNYVHKVGTSQDVFDESSGAVFLLCTAKTYTDAEGKTQPYFCPLVNGQDGFHSEYLAKDQLVVARGLFDNAKYPTAIRKQNGKIEFYRDVVNTPTFSSFIPKISYELPDGVTENPVTSVIRQGIQFFTGLDISDFVPYIYFDIDIMHLFGKSTKTIYKLADCGLVQDYTFADNTTKALMSLIDTERAQMKLTYSAANLNWIVLILATFIIFAKLFRAMIGLLRRIVDIMFLYVMYPAAVATIPYYGKSNFSNWTKEMITRIIAMYGFIIGINLGFLLLYPISNVTLITSDMFARSNLSWLNWNINLFGLPLFSMVSALNHLIRLLFYLVGVSFIFEIPKIVQGFVYKADKNEDYNGDIVSLGGAVTKGTKETFQKVAKIVSGQALMDTVKSAINFVPGSAIIADRKQRAIESRAAQMLGANHMNMGQMIQKNLNEEQSKKGGSTGGGKPSEAPKTPPKKGGATGGGKPSEAPKKPPTPPKK